MLMYPTFQVIFSKEFALGLEGQMVEFKCPLCNKNGEVDIPQKNLNERENLGLDLDSLEEIGELEF